MPTTLTLKNIPDDVYQRLKRSASEHRRSLNSEAIVCRYEARGTSVIVVDTNIIAYLYLESEFTARAEALLEAEPDWCVPPLWRSEFSNILAGAMRRKSLTFDDARRILAEAESLLLGCEQEVSSERVLAMVRDSECSASDCEFVALAARLGVRLVTMDGKLLRAFPQLAANLPTC